VEGWSNEEREKIGTMKCKIINPVMSNMGHL